MRERCAHIDFFPFTYGFFRERKLPQAIVTVNPDLFRETIVPLHRFDESADVIVCSFEEGTIDKGVLCQAALDRLAIGASPGEALLIDNRAENLEAWSARGGRGYRYLDDASFERDVAGGIDALVGDGCRSAMVGDREFRSLERHELEAIWTIDRSEDVEYVYRVRAGALVRVAQRHETRGWPDGEREHYGPLLLDCLDHGGVGTGVFEHGRLVATSVLENRLIGERRDQLQLKFLHVSRSQRGAGIGVSLFERAASAAQQRGARQLYVSATPTANTVDFYLRRGCRPVDRPDPDLFALEPEDIHLVCDLPLSPRGASE